MARPGSTLCEEARKRRESTRGFCGSLSRTPAAQGSAAAECGAHVVGTLQADGGLIFLSPCWYQPTRPFPPAVAFWSILPLDAPRRVARLQRLHVATRLGSLSTRSDASHISSKSFDFSTPASVSSTSTGLGQTLQNRALRAQGHKWTL